MRLTQIRKARGLTQTELAEMAGVEQPTISRIERGSRGVTLDVIYSIAEALEVPVAEIFMTEREFAEQVLLSAFRRLSHDRQQGWLDMVRAVRESRTEQAE